MANRVEAIEMNEGDVDDLHASPITLESIPTRSPADPTVMSAVRYLLYRYEMANGSEDLPQKIAVVSDTSDTGVTTVCKALSEVLAAERSSTVLWMDAIETGASLRNNQPSSDPSSIGKRGPTEWTERLFAGEQPSSFATARLSVRNLGVISSQPALDDLFKDLTTEFRHIVLDTPPVLSKSSSIGFLRHADAYILVARHGSTTLRQVEAASNDLKAIPSMGAILNDYRSRSPRFVRRFFSV